MFNPLFMRRVSQVLLLTFTTMTLQQSAWAIGHGMPAGQRAAVAGATMGDSLPNSKKQATRKAKSGKKRAPQRKSVKVRQGKQPIPVAHPIAAPQRPQPSEAAHYGRALEQLKRLAASAAAKQAPGQGQGQKADAEIGRLRAQQRELDALEIRVNNEFAATEAHIKAHKLPAVILARQQAAVQAFHAQQAALKQKLRALDQADDTVRKDDADKKADATQKAAAHKDRAQKLQDLNSYLQANQHEATRTTPALNKLPFNAQPTKPGKPRTPRRSLRQYRASLFKIKPVMLAGPIPNGFTMPATSLPATPTAADLAATEDIVLTPAIQAQAAALNNNPVQIYNWVRNNIEFVPSYGSIQGADMTLQTRRGNDMDTASLLIALYRAAGIPARYVYGTIQVPGNVAANWLGVSTPDAALQLLTQGGVPAIAVTSSGAVTSGGATTAIELEHVWVAAYVDYTPSRGAINKHPDTWIEMDPSYKQYVVTPGLSLGTAVSLNAQGVLDGAKQGAVCTADYAQSLNGPNISSAYTGYQGQLANYLNQQGPDLTVGGVLGTRSILAENQPILMGTLPYGTVVEGGQFTALPDVLRWKFSYNLYANTTDQSQNLPTLTYTASLPALQGKRVTVSYTPATAADAATLASYMPQPHADGTPILASEFPATLPAYLINLRAELRVDGQAVAAGGSFTMGSQQPVTASLFVPSSGLWDDRSADIVSGEYQAIVLDGQGVSAADVNALQAKASAVSAQLAAGQYATLSRDDVTGVLLQQAAMGYLAVADANTTIYGRASGVADLRMPSQVRAIARVEPQYAFGAIVAAGFPGVRLAIDRYAHAAVLKQAVSGSPGLPAGYNRQSMERASAWAADALQNLLNDPAHPGIGDSAVRAIAAANTNSQPMRLVNSSDAATVIPQLVIDANAVTDIQNAAAAGEQVIVQNGVLSANAWTGSGYVIEDTTTGSGDYLLTGPTNGVQYPAGGAGWPVLNGAPWPAGMTWLALADPVQSGASISYALNNGVTFDGLASVVLSGMDGARWTYFPGQQDVMNGLFLSGLNAITPANACDAVASMIASGMASSSGINNAAAGMALNHPPVIQSSPVVNGAAGAAYRYALIATDPDGDTLSYRVVNGPTGLAIDPATGVVTWASPLQGSYNITLRADDGKAYTDQSYILLIGQGALQLSLNLTVTPAVAAAPGDPVTISVVTMGGQGTVTRNLTVDGAAVTLDASGNATISAGAIGSHAIVATASDAVATLTRQGVYGVTNPADTTTPVAAITTPVQDAEVTAPVDIIGTAADDNLTYYTLTLKPAGAPDTDSVEIGRGYANVTNAKLGTLDPTVMANGLYDLGLTVHDANGQATTASIGVELSRNLKIGQFSLSYTDLDVNASGIPIRVTRTYDTRQKGSQLDFGYGWSVDYQSLKLRRNMVTGLDWNVTTSGFQICLRPGRVHKINIILPDGSMQRFTARNATDCATAQVPPVDVVFDPLPGTTSTLTVASVPSYLVAQGGLLYDGDIGNTWNPTDFVLTTEDNYQYYLTEGVGITSIVDPYGNTLTYGPNGITHSNGTGVAFKRDALNRITQVTDPMGKVISYGYDVNGNLASVTNRNNEKSQYAYNSAHGLTSYTDPSGTALVRYTYDAQGRMIAATDASGKSIQVNHDTANNQDVVTDRLGRTTTYVYDADGDITKVIDPTGATTTYGYDAYGNETSVTDPLGNTTKKTFDPVTFNQTSETDPLGHTTTDTYDPTNKSQLNSTTDANGNVTNYAYFTYAQNISGPLGSYTHVGYDSSGNLNALTAAGQSASYAYDAKGSPISEVDASGNVTTHTYDANGNELTTTRLRTEATGVKVSITTSKSYDAEGRVIAETDELGGVTKTAYNSAGQPISVTDPVGRVISYTYDSQGRQVKTTYPDGTSETTTFDAEGNRAATTDRAGRATTYSYDGQNRVTKTLHPDGTGDTVTYNAAGMTLATHDANGNPVTMVYDAAGRLSSSTDALGHTTSYSYDANGNRLTMTDANGKVTGYTYDALNRLTMTTYPDGTTRSVTYLTNGQKVTETDQNGNIVAYGYDALGRINKVTLTLAATGTTAVTTYAYDEVGNKVSQTDVLGRVTHWGYDNAGRVTSRTLPNGETESWTYDAVGNRTSHTDFAGRKTSYTYDVDGRVVFATDSSGQTTGYLYTASGRAASMSDSRGVTKYSYDARDRLVRQDNPDGTFLAYSYDANGNVTQRSTPAGTVAYAYDSLNRLVSVTDTAGKVTGYAYDANSNRIKTTLPNGTEADYSYDSLNHLTKVEHRTTATQAIIRGYAYTLKPNGQRAQTQEYDAAGTMTTRAYSYDSLNRLTQDVLTDSRTPANSSTTAYTFGDTGNRATRTVTQGGSTATTVYTYDADDRLSTEATAAGTTTYSWDANGNLTSKVEPTQTTLYTWDSHNRLASVARGSSAATAATVATYQYDANGNRVGKTLADGTKISYLVDSNMAYAQVAQEIDTSPTGSKTETDYLYGLERIQMTRGGQGTYYHDDGLGSTRVLTDASGNVTDSYEYDDYGALQSKTGITKNDFLYAGEAYDQEAGLSYNRARYLDLNVGRFTGLDPFGGEQTNPITLNKYAYAGDDPINGSDPSGLMTMTEGEATIEIRNTLMTVGNRIGGMMNLYDRVQGLKGFFDLIDIVPQIMGSDILIPPSAQDVSTGTIKKAIVAGTESFVYNLPRAIGTGIGDWALGYARSEIKGNSLSGVLMYMPLFIEGTGATVDVKTPVKVRFGNRKVPIFLVFGAPVGAAGQLFGLGLRMQGKEGNKDRQLIRMDWHGWHGTESATAGKGELARWCDGCIDENGLLDSTDRFHYHVRKWNQ